MTNPHDKAIEAAYEILEPHFLSATGDVARDLIRRAIAAYERELRQALYAVGDRVEKHTEDYQLGGEVRGVLRTKSGKVRYVVEHAPGFLHIYSEANIRPLPTVPEGE